MRIEPFDIQQHRHRLFFNRSYLSLLLVAYGVYNAFRVHIQVINYHIIMYLALVVPRPISVATTESFL